MSQAETVPLIRCKGCLCYVELPQRNSPFFQEEVSAFIAAHQFCPNKDED